MRISDGRPIGNYNPEKFKNYTPLTTIVVSVTIVSFLWILLYKLWFLKIKEFFSGASVLGEIFYNIFLSVIASAVFYFIVVYLPERRKKLTIDRVVSRRIGKLNLDYRLIKQDLYQLKNKKIPEDLPTNFNEIVRLCDGILLTDKSPHIHNNPEFHPANWFEYFEYYFALENHNIEHLNRYWEEIPSEVKVLIDELESGPLKSALEMYKTTGYSNSLSDLGGPIWVHLDTLRKINITFQSKWNK